MIVLSSIPLLLIALGALYFFYRKEVSKPFTMGRTSPIESPNRSNHPTQNDRLACPSLTTALSSALSLSDKHLLPLLESATKEGKKLKSLLETSFGPIGCAIIANHAQLYHSLSTSNNVPLSLIEDFYQAQTLLSNTIIEVIRQSGSVFYLQDVPIAESSYTDFYQGLFSSKTTECTKKLYAITQNQINALMSHASITLFTESHEYQNFLQKILNGQQVRIENATFFFNPHTQRINTFTPLNTIGQGSYKEAHRLTLASTQANPQNPSEIMLRKDDLVQKKLHLGTGLSWIWTISDEEVFKTIEAIREILQYALDFRLFPIPSCQLILSELRRGVFPSYQSNNQQLTFFLDEGYSTPDAAPFQIKACYSTGNTFTLVDRTSYTALEGVKRVVYEKKLATLPEILQKETHTETLDLAQHAFFATGPCASVEKHKGESLCLATLDQLTALFQTPGNMMEVLNRFESYDAQNLVSMDIKAGVEVRRDGNILIDSHGKLSLIDPTLKPTGGGWDIVKQCATPVYAFPYAPTIYYRLYLYTISKFLPGYRCITQSRLDHFLKHTQLHQTIAPHHQTYALVFSLLYTLDLNTSSLPKFLSNIQKKLRAFFASYLNDTLSELEVIHDKARTTPGTGRIKFKHIQQHVDSFNTKMNQKYYGEALKRFFATEIYQQDINYFYANDHSKIAKLFKESQELQRRAQNLHPERIQNAVRTLQKNLRTRSRRMRKMFDAHHSHRLSQLTK